MQENDNREGTSQPGSPEKIYEWEVAQIGDASPPFVYPVTAENIADYCRAVQYENPIYTNEGAAKEAGHEGILAPPTMIYTYAPQRRVDVVAARGYVAPEQSLAAPRSTPFVATEVRFQGASVVPGDTVTSVTWVADKFQRRDNKFITFRVTAHNQRNELIVEYDYVCLWESPTRKAPPGS